ncbi:MAG: hypothetical protein Q7R81_02885 [Candidatus Peregrinibacteria bacterium]|nr:hypothetical protein [Candidatus Peregrinibacteria bacterium]
MKKIPLASAYLLIVFLAACTGGTKAPTPTDGTGSGAEKADAATEEASQRKNPLFNANSVIGRKNFSLSARGQKALPGFLSKIGLPALSGLDEVAGMQKLNQKTCDSIFKKFKLENPTSGIKGEQCGWNLNEDGTYTDVDPLVFSLSELDGKLLLLIDEEGLGAPTLFTYVYDMDSGKVSSFSRPSLGETTAYYHNDMLYFVNVSGYLQFAYNVKNMSPIPIENPPS